QIWTSTRHVPGGPGTALAAGPRLYLPTAPKQYQHLRARSLKLYKIRRSQRAGTRSVSHDLRHFGVARGEISSDRCMQIAQRSRATSTRDSPQANSHHHKNLATCSEYGNHHFFREYSDGLICPLDRDF